MRIVEMSLFLIFTLASIALVPLLVPTYGVFPTGNADLSFVNKMNLTELESNKPSEDASIIDQASYFFLLAVKSVAMFADFMFSIVTVIPAVGEIFRINPVLLGVFGVVIACLGIIAWIQFAKGDSFEGKR